MDYEKAKPQKPLSPRKVQTYATMQAAAARGATIEQLATRHNVSEEHVRDVLGLKLPPSDEEIAAQPISVAAQKILDAKLRSFRKDFDYEVEVAARELHRKWREEMSLPHYFEKLEEVESLLNSPRWAVMPIDHYKTILSRLHPDRARPGDEAAAAEAFALFNSYKPKLVDLSSEKEEKDRLKRIEARGAPLPRTVEEMLARKTMKGRR